MTHTPNRSDETGEKIATIIMQAIAPYHKPYKYLGEKSIETAKNEILQLLKSRPAPERVEVDWKADDSHYRTVLAEAMMMPLTALSKGVDGDTFADELIKARNKIDAVVEQIINTQYDARVAEAYTKGRADEAKTCEGCNGRCEARVREAVEVEREEERLKTLRWVQHKWMSFGPTGTIDIVGREIKALTDHSELDHPKEMLDKK